MFVKKESKKSFKELLRKYLDSGDEVTIHYECGHCGDEQVTGFISIEEGVVASFEEEGIVYMDMPCTTCGDSMRLLEESLILGVEEK